MPIQLVSDVHWWIAYNATVYKTNNETNRPKYITKKLRGKNITIDLTKSNYSSTILLFS